MPFYAVTMPYSEYPRTRAEAKERGMKRWFPGVPCRKGHVGLFFVEPSTCVECNKEAKRRYKEKDPEAARVRAREQSQRFRERNPGYHAEFQVGFRERNAERIAAMKETWPSCQPGALQAAYQARKKKMLAAARQRRYGLLPTQYEALLVAQEGRCAICRTDDPGPRYESLLVDHCHGSNTVRGLLCVRCNMGLGMFFDRPDLLSAAAEYLTAPPAYGLFSPDRHTPHEA